MIQRWNSECVKCLMRKHMDVCPEDASEEQKLTYLNRLFEILRNAKPEEGAPVITDYILKLQKEMLGIFDDYTEIKRTFNDLMLAHEDPIRSRINAAKDPIHMAIQYVMTGNYIDFGVVSDVTSEGLLTLLSGAESQAVDEASFRQLLSDLSQSSRLVYLTDNCGEIVLDKLLIEAIRGRYPDLHADIIVRGSQALNDATIEDAIQVGLDTVGTITGNGTSIPGTHLPDISREAHQLIEQADVIISKGQGNFETLRGCGLNIYYLFLCKCKLFTEKFHKNLYEGMLLNERDA